MQDEGIGAGGVEDGVCVGCWGGVGVVVVVMLDDWAETRDVRKVRRVRRRSGILMCECVYVVTSSRTSR